MKNALGFLLMTSAIISSCRIGDPEEIPEPNYYYYATFEYMLDEGTHTTNVNGVITRDTIERQGEWDPTIGSFSVNNTLVNYVYPGFDWQATGYTDGDVIFDSPGRTHFDHFFDADDSLFNRLPAGTDTIHLGNYYIDIGTDSILQDEYLVLFITQGSSLGKYYFNYDSQTGTYRASINTGDMIVAGPATVQLSRRRHSDPISAIGGSTVHCVYECRGALMNVIIIP